MIVDTGQFEALTEQVAELAVEVSGLRKQLVLKTLFEELCDSRPDRGLPAARRHGRRPSYLRLVSGGTR